MSDANMCLIWGANNILPFSQPLVYDPPISGKKGSYNGGGLILEVMM